MQNGERLSLGQIRAFLEATDEVRFEAAKRVEVYAWISRTLCEREYWKQRKGNKGVLRRYLQKMTGLSRAQVTRGYKLNCVNGHRKDHTEETDGSRLFSDN